MVCLDLDHPDIEEFINWKVIEERKVAALVTGSKICKKRLVEITTALKETTELGDARFNAKTNKKLKKAVAQANKDMVPMNYVHRVIELFKQGVTDIQFEEYDTDWNSEAYNTVSGQNSNNSVRISNKFFDALKADGDWHLTNRTDGKGGKNSEGKKTFGSKLTALRGTVLIQVFSLMIPSMNGIHVHKREESMLLTLVLNICSSIIQLVT